MQKEAHASAVCSLGLCLEGVRGRRVAVLISEHLHAMLQWLCLLEDINHATGFLWSWHAVTVAISLVTVSLCSFRILITVFSIYCFHCFVCLVCEFFEVGKFTKARRRQILISIGEGNTKISQEHHFGQNLRKIRNQYAVLLWAATGKISSRNRRNILCTAFCWSLDLLIFLCSLV